jgi:hypothetical protein
MIQRIFEVGQIAILDVSVELPFPFVETVLVDRIQIPPSIKRIGAPDKWRPHWNPLEDGSTDDDCVLQQLDLDRGCSRS